LDRITAIEAQLGDVLLTIDGKTHGAYKYLSELKSVYFEQDDEAVTISDGGYPSIVLRMSPNETILSGESKAYRNMLRYTLECKVENLDPSVNPRQALKVLMNELEQDIKFCLSNNYHLNDTCDIVSINSFSRNYNKVGNVLRAGELKVDITIQYSQSRLNPAINICI